MGNNCCLRPRPGAPKTPMRPAPKPPVVRPAPRPR